MKPKIKDVEWKIITRESEIIRLRSLPSSPEIRGQIIELQSEINQLNYLLKRL